MAAVVAAGRLGVPAGLGAALVAVLLGLYLTPSPPPDETAGVEPVPSCPGAEEIPALIEAARDPCWQVREEAAARLGQIGDERTVRVLMEVLRADEAPEVRAAAAEGLGRIHANPAAGALIEALQDDSPVVRARAGAAMRVLLHADVNYRAEDPPAQREQAIEKIKYLWYKIEQWRAETDLSRRR